MWYSQGTITATNNNTVINGSGTAFIQGVRVGDGITIAGSTSLHEVISIASNTQMTIKPAYTGATGAGKQYAVAPVLGYDKDLSDAFNQLRLQFGDKLSSLQPWAHAATASAALDALDFSTSGKVISTGDPEAARGALGLNSAATRNVGLAAGDVLEVGSYGFGGGLPVATNSEIGDTKVFSAMSTDASGSAGFGAHVTLLNLPYDGGNRVQLGVKQGQTSTGDYSLTMRSITSGFHGIVSFYHTGNTTKNPDGTLKASSPVINLYTDKHDLHNEGQFGATPAVVRKSKGVYEITGTLGLRSEGWYLDTPSDRNGNKYFNVEWTQNMTPEAVDGVVDGYQDDIVVTIETFERVWNKETGMFDNGAPIDINELQDRFVQLRFNEIKVELDNESFN